ncbi:MAG TPA: hypothetical protein VMT96_00555 [Candidatus Bathyarchaeia archaeon]|nr:hypothetical protein [Candidatus Bathyarchaeia archaeon]
MKAIFAAIKRSPRLAALVAAVVAAVIIPSALMAWGPDRQTYTTASPADHVTFDSITDNPAYGDERNFVRIKPADASDSAYSDNTTVEPGKTYDVYVYYHNDASSTLNDAAHNQVGIAQNVNLRMEMPATVQSGETADINGYITASNANPGTVYDDSKVTASADVALRYVPGSATIHNFGSTNGQTLPDSLVTTGTPLGYNALDGTIPGCNEYSGYAVFSFTAVQPNFEVTKQVSISGQNNYSDSVNVKPGDQVDYKISYVNTGTTQQDNVVIADDLPQDVTYVPGSTYMSSSQTNDQWSPVSGDDIINGGINIGSFAPDGGAYVKFTATVGDVPCGTNNTLTNSASANTPNGSKSATANVVVAQVCQGGITPSSLPMTGPSTGVMTFIGLGTAAAGVAYAATSTRVRNLLRR